MSLPVVLDAAFCTRLALTLAHFLWEGAVIALVAAVIAWALRKASSRARYAVWVAALGVMVVSLVITYIQMAPILILTEAEYEARMKAGDFREPDIIMAESAQMPVAGIAGEAESSPSEVREAPGAATAPARGLHNWQMYSRYVVWAYFAGVGAMLLRVAVAMGGGRRLRRRSEPVDDPALLESLARQAKMLGMRFTPAAAYCKRIAVPTVVGVVKPAILLPLSLMTGLTPQQVDLLLLHELAHIRRYDPLVNFLQRVAEAILFFHPAVWYVSHRIRVEREHCCDDLVAAHGGAHAYAESLVVAAALAHGIRASSVGGVAAFGRASQLRRRIARLLGVAEPGVRLARGGWVLALLAVPLLALAVMQAASSQTPTGLPPLTGSALDEAIQQLKDPDWWLRQVAAQQLGESGDKAAVMPLIGALKDEDARVQAAAARSLGTLADPRAIKHLVAVLKEGGARDAAAEALTKFDAEGVMLLVRVAAGDTDPEVQLGAVAALERIQPADALDLLMEMLPKVSDKGPGVNVRRVRLSRISEAMENIDPARAVELLKGGAVSADPAMREAVKELVKARPFAGAEGVVIALSQDSANTMDMLEVVSKSIERAIEKRTGPSAQDLEIIRTLAGSNDARTRAAAVTEAGRLLYAFKSSGTEPDPLLLETVRNALTDDHGAVMAVAARGLEASQWAPTTPKEKAAYWVAYALVGGNAPQLWATQIAPLGEDAKEALLHALKVDITPIDFIHAPNVHEAHSYAAFGLGKLKAKEAVPGIIAVLNEPDSAFDGIRALGEIGDPAAIEALLPFLHSEDEDLRIVSATALGELKAKEAVPGLLELLSDPKAGAEAAKALGKIGDPGPIESLIAALTQPDDSARSAAAGALIALKDPRAVPGVLKLLTNENVAVRQAALTVLAEVKDPSVAPTVVDLLKTEQDIRVQLLAATALARQGDPAGADALTVLALPRVTRGDRSLPKQAVAGLSQLGEAGTAGLIKVLGQSQDDTTRREVAQTLGEMNCAAAVSALADAVTLDPSGEVSSEAALALGRITAPAAVDALVAALTSNSNRWHAIVEGLGQSKLESSTEALAQLLNSEVFKRYADLRPRLMIAEKLAQRGDSRARPVLEELSKEPTTRLRASAALSELSIREKGEASPPPAPTGLEGTRWQVGDYEVAFNDSTVCNIKGGTIPDGMDGTYELQNGVLTVRLGNETRSGSWDGQTLMVDGRSAERLP